MRTLKNILSLSYKELRSLLGDTVLVVLIVMVFTILVYNASKNISTDVHNAQVGVVDMDRSQLSRQIVDALLPPQFAKPVHIQREEIDALMDKGNLVFVLEFPPNFQRDVAAGRAPAVQLLVDATSMTQAGVGQGYISQIFNREVAAFLRQSGRVEAIMPAKPVLNTLFNPNGDSSWFMAVSQVNNMISLLALVLVGAAVIRERERGTMEHLLVMPVSAAEIVLSKLLANGLVVCVAATLSMRFMAGGVIGVPLAGSLALYVSGAVAFMFSMASLAVMLATFTPTMPQYSLLMVPLHVVTMMFSGSTSPRSNMPEAAQWISQYWPTTLFAELTQNVLFRGAGADIVWPQLALLAATGLLFLVFALARFRAMLEKHG